MRSQLAALFLVFSLSANAQTLNGAIDIHAHADPDGVPRKLDAVDLARLAKEAGMRAIVLKNHYEPTASLAYIVRKEVPGIEVFGGISLDLTVGGVNPAAVEWMTKIRGGYGRVIWLPTFDAEAQVKRTGQQRPFAPVVRDGKVVPEVAEVIAIAARNNLVLETGHSSGSEDLVIIDAIRDSTSCEARRVYRAGLWRAFRRPAAQGRRCDPRCRSGLRGAGKRPGSTQQSSPY